MRTAVPTSIFSLALAALLASAAAPGQSGGESVTQARPAWAFSPDSRCPELHAADDGPRAVVRFRVSAYGAPSEVHIQVSSQSEALDAAAVKCVERLKFQPRTRLGDATPVDSWQEIAWRWRAPPAAVPTAAAPPVAPGAAPAAAVTAPAAARAPASAPAAAVVRACTDASGQLEGDPTLVASSGNPTSDAAALKIARAGAPYYAAAGGAATGCVRLSVGFEGH